MRTDRTDIAREHDAIRTDAGNIRASANNIRSDRQDLRADRHDLRADGQDFRAANPSQAQRVARNDIKPGSTPVNAGKVQLSSSTLANNAAENSRKNQHQQTMHKAWYHWFW
jgi:hypothetical protein